MADQLMVKTDYRIVHRVNTANDESTDECTVLLLTLNMMRIWCPNICQTTTRLLKKLSTKMFAHVPEASWAGSTNAVT